MISWNPARLVSMAALIVALALAVACGSSNPASPGSTPAVNTSSATSPGTGAGPTSGSTGTLRVMLRDSPFGEASAVLVSFNGVSVHRSGGGWESLEIEGEPVALTCDLKKLQGPLALLGTAVLTSGHYTQIRLNVSSATIYKNGTAPVSASPCAATAFELAPNSDPDLQFHDVIVPSGEIKLNREFDLAAGGTTVIELDFDGDKSITQTGNGKYMMKPVIGIISVTVQ